MCKKKVAIVMGSPNDMKVVKDSIKILKDFDLKFEVFIISAHKSPNLAINFSKTAKEKGFCVIIAAAGMAAHLAGFVAANTTLPVIGLPINCSLNGIDSLFSTVQMPSGVPVLTVGINSAKNAAIAAAQIIATSNDFVYKKLETMKKDMEEKIFKNNKDLNF